MDKYDLNNNSVADILSIYFNQKPYNSDNVDELQNCYDRCMEILDSITVTEIDLLWQLRQMPHFSRNIIINFVKENYEYYKSYSFKTSDIVRQKSLDNHSVNT